MPDYLQLLGHETEPPTAVCKTCGAQYFPIHGARSTECCQCRRARRQRAKSAAPRPRELDPKAFQSQKQLDAWWGKDLLECHICGQEVSGLQYHVRFVHKVSSAEYRQRFNIPATYGLIGKRRREAAQACARATTERMKASGYKNLETARKNKTGKRLRLTSFQEQERLKRMLASDKHPSKREGVELLYCTKCGDPVEMPASVAALHQCNARCEKCNPRKSSRRKYK